MAGHNAAHLRHADITGEIIGAFFEPPGSREQLLNYLRLLELRVGLLLFFGPVPDFQRLVH